MKSETKELKKLPFYAFLTIHGMVKCNRGDVNAKLIKYDSLYDQYAEWELECNRKPMRKSRMAKLFDCFTQIDFEIERINSEFYVVYKLKSDN